MNPADLSDSDWAALVELRRRLSIRIDEAGAHAESLARLQAARLVDLETRFCVLTEEQLTDDLRALGFEGGGGTGVGGQRYTQAPHWVWPVFAGEVGDAPSLLRLREGRTIVEIDWDDFCAFCEDTLVARDECPTITQVAERFGHGVLDTADWIDRRYWAFRIPVGEIADQTVELEGE